MLTYCYESGWVSVWGAASFLLWYLVYIITVVSERWSSRGVVLSCLVSSRLVSSRLVSSPLVVSFLVLPLSTHAANTNAETCARVFFGQMSERLARIKTWTDSMEPMVGRQQSTIEDAEGAEAQTLSALVTISEIGGGGSGGFGGAGFSTSPPIPLSRGSNHKAREGDAAEGEKEVSHDHVVVTVGMNARHARASSSNAVLSDLRGTETDSDDNSEADGCVVS